MRVRNAAFRQLVFFVLVLSQLASAREVEKNAPYDLAEQRLLDEVLAHAEAQLRAAQRRQASNSTGPRIITPATYQCKNCLKDSFGDELPIVVMYISDESRKRVCNNMKAAQKLKQMGRYVAVKHHIVCLDCTFLY